MTARRSRAVEDAMLLARSGATLSAAARKAGCALSSVKRALRADGEPPRKPGRRKNPAPPAP